MKTNARQSVENYPEAIAPICENHSMDDFVNSIDSIEAAIDISKEVRQIHKHGGFKLRWFTSISNDVTLVLDGVSSS